MSQTLTLSQDCSAPLSARERIPASTWAFGLVMLIVATAAALLAGWAPLGFSIVTVFLFAGPHNWIEARYFLSRLPGRLGKLRGYFGLAFAGVFGLTIAYAALAWLQWDWGESNGRIALAIWNSTLVLWIVLLVHLRSRQNPRRDWSWTAPIGLMVVGLAWLHPEGWALALVFLHPLMAFWILDRELQRSRPEWLGTYRACLLTVPLLLGLLWWRLSDSPSLPGIDAFTQRITRHAGADLLPGVSSHLLVATHTFLEMLHYAAWLLAIPLVSMAFAPWRIGQVPMARRSQSWRWAVGGILFAGGAAVIVLWCGFLADYPLTRDVYFTVAMLHVLAEVPFLLRAL